MEFTGVSIIIICCYLLGEIYKVVFKKKKDLYKLIPIFMGIIGGILAYLIYLITPEIIFNVDNIWDCLEIGIVSGLSSTGSNQVIKQILKKEA